MFVLALYQRYTKKNLDLTNLSRSTLILLSLPKNVVLNSFQYRLSIKTLAARFFDLFLSFNAFENLFKSFTSIGGPRETRFELFSRETKHSCIFLQ